MLTLTALLGTAALGTAALGTTALGTASTAEAQQLPIDAQLTIHHDTELSCSQSYQSTGRQLDLHLSVDASGAARLTLDASSRETSGSASEMFQPGPHDTSHIQRREQHAWTGTASRQGGRARIVFDQDRTSSAVWQGYGTLPLPPARTLRTQLVIECEPTQLSVYPTDPTQVPFRAGANEAPSAVSGWSCRVVSGAPDVLREEAAEPLPFATSAPLVLHVSDGMMGMDGRLLRRR